jgi:hypothetical protein
MQTRQFMFAFGIALALGGAVAVSSAMIPIPFVGINELDPALRTERIPYYFQKGRHQIYVWCTQGRGDDSVDQTGQNAEDAIRQASTRRGPNCWGVWQGLWVPS